MTLQSTSSSLQRRRKSLVLPIQMTSTKRKSRNLSNQTPFSRPWQKVVSPTSSLTMSTSPRS